MQIAERKKLPAKNPPPLQVYHSELKERESFPDKGKLNEFITTELGLQKFKGISLSWKERVLISNKKTHESKNLTGKGKYIVKEVD